MSLLVLDLFSTRINNRSLSAEPELLGLTPVPGQPASLRCPVRTTVCTQLVSGYRSGPDASRFGLCPT